MPNLTLDDIARMAGVSPATVSRVSDDKNAELLRYLDELGIRPGTEFTLLDTAPFDGPLTIAVGQEEKIVGRRAADSVYVKLD